MDLLQRLTRALDRPLFPWKGLIAGFTIGQYLFEQFLAFRQFRVLQGNELPKVLKHEVSQEVFDKSQAYGRAKLKFGFVSALYGQIQNLGIMYYDILPKIWALTGTWLLHYFPKRFSGEISHSLLFVFVFNIISTIASLPLDYYGTFVLEQKYGFNKSTVKLWVTDMLKSQLLIIVLGTPILSGFLTIIQKTGNTFFVYLWLFMVIVQVFAITIYPIFILPLFNKLSPLEKGPLKDGVEALARKLKFPLQELHVIDGSKRSAHSNAYFYGLPWKKHIVIYDTLIDKSETEEVVAVLSHELGHWSLSHTTRLFLVGQAHTFFIFTLFSSFISNHSLYNSFGFHKEFPIIIGFLLFSDVLTPMDSILKFMMNILSRRFEFQADAFAVQLGYAAELAKSLIKLQVQNLSTMEADWMYASYHYSHPILPERLLALGWTGKAKVGPDEEKEKDEEKPVKAADREL